MCYVLFLVLIYQFGHYLVHKKKRGVSLVSRRCFQHHHAITAASLSPCADAWIWNNKRLKLRNINIVTSYTHVDVITFFPNQYRRLTFWIIEYKNKTYIINKHGLLIGVQPAAVNHDVVVLLFISKLQANVFHVNHLKQFRLIENQLMLCARCGNYAHDRTGVCYLMNFDRRYLYYHLYNFA